MTPGGIRLAEQLGVTSDTYYQDAAPDVFTPGAWQRWTMQLDASGPTAQCIITVDGIEVVRRALINSFQKGELRLYLGALFVRDGAAREVWFDDVVLRVP